jgi:hypothetical protein
MSVEQLKRKRIFLECLTAVIGGIFFGLSSSPHVAVVHHSQQDEERKNGEGSSQALGRGTSLSLSAIQMENEDPADVSYQSDACH